MRTITLVLCVYSVVFLRWVFPSQFGALLAKTKVFSAWRAICCSPPPHPCDLSFSSLAERLARYPFRCVPLSSSPMLFHGKDFPFSITSNFFQPRFLVDLLHLVSPCFQPDLPPRSHTLASSPPRFPVPFCLSLTGPLLIGLKRYYPGTKRFLFSRSSV